MLAALVIGAVHANNNATCHDGSLGGGILYQANLTIADSVAWCVASPKCGGFAAQQPFPAACNSTAVLAVYFRDHYGAVRPVRAKGWTYWIPVPPPPTPAPPPPVTKARAHVSTLCVSMC